MGTVVFPINSRSYDGFLPACAERRVKPAEARGEKADPAAHRDLEERDRVTANGTGGAAAKPATKMPGTGHFNGNRQSLKRCLLVGWWASSIKLL